MSKNFQDWHTRKSLINNNENRLFFHEREVWSASIGANIGFEQDGKGCSFLRPIIIIKKFNNEIFWCLPLTRNQKKGKYYSSFILNNSISTAILSQIRLIDSKRLQYKIGDISQRDYVDIKEKLKQFLT